MDVNGTRFHLLLGRSDWECCLDAQLHPLRQSWSVSSSGPAINEAGVDWQKERSELTLHQRLMRFVAARGDTPPALEARRGSARDRYGNWYWIDKTRREILVLNAGTHNTTHFWSCGDDLKCEKAESAPGDFQALEVARMPSTMEFGSLAVSLEHYLVVACTNPAGLLIFDLHAGGTPRQLFWPRTVDFRPFDMVAAPDGGVFILDRFNKCYWILDRQFNILGKPEAGAPAGPNAAEPFQPSDGSAAPHVFAQTAPGAITGAAAAMSLRAVDPIAIEALGDGSVLILDGNPDQPAQPIERFSRIHRYRFEEELGTFVTTEAMLSRIEDEGAAFSLLGEDFTLVPAAEDAAGDLLGQLYVVERGGNQTYAFELREGAGQQLELEGLTDYLPMRLFGGKALVAAGGQVFYDFDDRWIPLIAQPRPRYTSESVIYTPLNGSEISDQELIARGLRNAFDGREPDCVWHRLMIDACIPPETEVQVWSRAANEQRELALAQWQREPGLHLRRDGSELPFIPGRTTALGGGTWELLLQNARGRYLQLQLGLIGNGRSSPRLYALRAYYPRFSYLNHYLPAVYREDQESASFLDRFLSNIEGFYTSIEDRIAMAQVLLDARTTPPEALDWLAGWFGVALDPAWDERKRRLFIKHGVSFFQLRGTMRGLEIALRLVLEDCVDETLFDASPPRTRRPSGIRIVEKYLTRRASPVVFGDPTDTPLNLAGLQATRWLVVPVNQSRAATPEPGTFGRARENCRCGKSAKANEGAAIGAGEALSVDGAVAISEERTQWQQFLKGLYPHIDAFNAAYHLSGANRLTTFEQVSLPADFPVQDKPREDWQKWLSFSSAAGISAARTLWQEFLARRYGQVVALNKAYNTDWPSFQFISLPDAKPPRSLPSQDWQQFAGIVLAMHGTAHRFTVLLPMPESFHEDQSEHQRRRALAERITNLEKPAHTLFEVKFYWGAFRVGEARLGTDTLMGRGGRSPQLMQRMVLGQGYLAENFLAAPNSQDVIGRQALNLEVRGG
jgi:phage tail-like protein